MSPEDFWKSRSELTGFCPFPESHTRCASDGWAVGTAQEDTVVVIQANGVRAIKRACRWCRNVSSAVPLAFALEHFDPLGPVVVVARPGEDVCVHEECQSTEVEWHHFAPRNTFDDADNWPVLPLCRDHHIEWHRRMDGYRWRNVREIA